MPTYFKRIPDSWDRLWSKFGFQFCFEVAQRFFGQAFAEWSAVKNLKCFDLRLVLFDVIAEGSNGIARGFGGFRIGTGKEKFVLRDGVDRLIGGALDREDFVSEIGIGGNGGDGFLNEVNR